MISTIVHFISDLCLRSDSWKYGDDIHSSVTIFARSLPPNQTYQFMVQLTHIKDPTLHSIAYSFVHIETNPSFIIISCIVSTMCSSKSRLIYINSNTQLGFYSLCLGTCSSIIQMKWNIYQGNINRSTGFIDWILIDSSLFSGIFGM